MRIGAVVAEDGDTLVPLSDGPTVVIAESESGELARLAHPAAGQQKGRRAAVVRLLVERGVQAVLSVPGAFCTYSAGLAREHELEFIAVEAGTRLSQVLADPETYLSRRTSSLPKDMLFVAVPGEARQK